MPVAQDWRRWRVGQTIEFGGASLCSCLCVDACCVRLVWVGGKLLRKLSDRVAAWVAIAGSAVILLSLAVAATAVIKPLGS